MRTIEQKEKDRIYFREYYKKNKTKIRAKNDAWMKNNAERYKQAVSDWHHYFLHE